MFTGKTYSTTRLGEEGIGISFPNLMRKQSTSVQKEVANIQENARRNSQTQRSLFLMLRCSPSVESVGSGGLTTNSCQIDSYPKHIPSLLAGDGTLLLGQHSRFQLMTSSLA